MQSTSCFSTPTYNANRYTKTGVTSSRVDRDEIIMLREKCKVSYCKIINKAQLNRLTQCDMYNHLKQLFFTILVNYLLVNERTIYRI